LLRPRQISIKEKDHLEHRTLCEVGVMFDKSVCKQVMLWEWLNTIRTLLQLNDLCCKGFGLCILIHSISKELGSGIEQRVFCSFLWLGGTIEVQWLILLLVIDKLSNQLLRVLSIKSYSTYDGFIWKKTSNGSKWILCYNFKCFIFEVLFHLYIQNFISVTYLKFLVS